MTPARQDAIRALVIFATLLPLAGGLLLIITGRRLFTRGAGAWATAVAAAAFGCAAAALAMWLGTPPGARPAGLLTTFVWVPLDGLPAGALTLGVLIDPLTLLMAALVTGVAALVHLYSLGYMAGDPRYRRFFAYLGFFTFAMLGVVIAPSLPMLYVFWELVGLMSYLLIGFWFERPGPRRACTKAFLMNRVGDTGFLLGMALLAAHTGGRLLLPAAEGLRGDGTLGLLGALTAPAAAGGLGVDVLRPPGWLTAAGIALFFGAMGKSAQFPLQSWLPDAMEGPTPVSSLVHSATMVAAGVYLTARLYPILTPGAHLCIAGVGLVTLALGAAAALAVTDLKRVLAYSTISQLGYMTLGLGAGAYGFALYHLVTHAFFKGGLFQCAGSVLRAAHHKGDLRAYGGLWRKLPLTAGCYAVGTLAIAGAALPGGVGLTGGYYSKEGLLAAAALYGESVAEVLPGGRVFFWVPVAVAYLTAFYMARSFTLTFLGPSRDAELHAHAREGPWTMRAPQLALAALAVAAAPWGMSFLLDLINASLPGGETGGVAAGTWAYPAAEAGMERGFDAARAWAGAAAPLGLALGVAAYLRGPRLAARVAVFPLVCPLHAWLAHGFYFDALYDTVAAGTLRALAAATAAVDRHAVDGAVSLAAAATRAAGRVAAFPERTSPDGAARGGRVRVYLLGAFASAAVVMLVVLAWG